jgi:hypothetical protein
MKRILIASSINLAIWVAAACSPCHAWDDEDDFSGDGFKSKTTQNNYGYKSHQSEDTSFAAQQRSSLKVDSIQEAHEKQRRWHEDFNAHNKRVYEDQEKKWDKLQAKQEAENDEWEAEQWRDVETVAGAFVASGPFYKAGQRMVQTDKGLAYSTGNGSVITPEGYYFRSGNLWVGPNGLIAGQSGSENNSYIWGSDGGSAIGSGRGYFTERGFSWPAYPEQANTSVARTMRKP